MIWIYIYIYRRKEIVEPMLQIVCLNILLSLEQNIESQIFFKCTSNETVLYFDDTVNLPIACSKGITLFYFKIPQSQDLMLI